MARNIVNIVNFGGNRITKGKLAGHKTYYSVERMDPTYKTDYCSDTAKTINTDTSLYGFFRTFIIEEKRKFTVAKAKGLNGSIKALAEVAAADGNGTEVAIAERNAKGAITIKACVINSDGVLKDYDVEKHYNLIKLVILPFILDDSEAMHAFIALKELCAHAEDDAFWDNPDNVEALYGTLCLYSNNIYYRQKNYIKAGKKALVCNDELKKLTMDNIKATRVGEVLYGSEPSFFRSTKVANMETGASGDDRKGLYQLMPEMPLSEKEAKLVPTMPKWYVWPAWTELEAKLICKSSKFAVPFRSLLLYGVSGTGKTEGAKAIFSLLGIPYGSVSCSVDMTMFDFLGQIIPNVKKWGNKDAESVASELGLPTFDDVANNFEEAYTKLFGIKPDEYASPEDCYKKLSEKMMSNNSDGEPDFIYEETDFVKAYRNGWGLEIQEPTIIKRNSVLAGLNKALDNDPDMASITLPTGEVVKRHPRFVCIMTTNRDYDGCSAIQQSVLSRMQNERKIANPEIEELADRVLKETGFADRAALNRMTSMIRKINDYCNVSDVTDGVCGPRELSNWAKRALMLQMLEDDSDDVPKVVAEHNIIKAAFPTILEKVSQVAEDQEAIIVEVFQKEYAEALVVDAREEYESGVA